jgi:hypothetical protein
LGNNLGFLVLEFLELNYLRELRFGNTEVDEPSERQIAKRLASIERKSKPTTREKNSLRESFREVREELVLVLGVKLSGRLETLVGSESHIGTELTKECGCVSSQTTWKL